MPDKGIRYYIHGDLVEGDPTRYYCARCDMFNSVELHKRGADPRCDHLGDQDDRDRVKMGFRILKMRKAREGWYRPAEADRTNLHM